jgi:hypothetical protein
MFNNELLAHVIQNNPALTLPDCTANTEGFSFEYPTLAKASFFDCLPVFLMIFAKQILAKVEVTHRGVTIDSTSFAKQL